MIINRIYEHQNLLSLWLVSFLVRLRTYQHPCKGKAFSLHATKTYGEVAVYMQLHSFLSSALNEDEWTTSRSSHLPPRKQTRNPLLFTTPMVNCIADERRRQPVQSTVAQQYGKGPGARLSCTCLCFFRKYHYLPTVQINPFRPNLSRCANDSQSFRFSSKIFVAGQPMLGDPEKNLTGAC